MQRLVALLGVLAIAGFIFGTAMSCNSPAGNEATADDGTRGSMSSQADADPAGVVAKGGGVEITRKELDEAVAGQRYQLEQQLYQMQRQQAMQLILEKVIKKRSGGMEIEDYLEQEANKEPVTDAEIEKIYNMNKARLGGGELTDQVREQIRNYIVGQRQQEYVNKLIEETDIDVMLDPPDPPRVTVSVDDDPSKGPDDAPVTIIEFSDFQCPACRQAAQLVPGVLKEFEGKVKFVYRDFPLMRKHPQAFKAAIAAGCAADQDKFWEMHDTLFANQRKLQPEDLKGYAKDLGLDVDKFEKCFADADSKRSEEIRKDMADANKIGVSATPTFVINGMMISGASPDTMRRLIRKELGMSTEES